jgi:hypothetical protein
MNEADRALIAKTLIAETPRGKATTKVPDSPIKRRGRKGAREGRKAN